MCGTASDQQGSVDTVPWSSLLIPVSSNVYLLQISLGHWQKRVETLEEKILCARSGMQT